jgi:O-acetyl-ADP-ribose deacetylase
MFVSNLCKNYFNGFQEISNYEQNEAKDNTLAFLKILSYFTGVIPLCFGIVYGISSLFGRICKRSELSDDEKRVNNTAKERLSMMNNPNNETLSKPVVKSLPIQIPESKELKEYTNDLSQEEKSRLKVIFIDDYMLQITFSQMPNLDFTIRRQDLFESKADVIVNAANTHLGGGGGIDGKIHSWGGPDYVNAHKDLKKLYNSNYTSGYAAMIKSGSLQEKGIRNVIVVAGPQGETSLKKEKELYNCYFNSLLLANSQNKTSIAFPSISTGIFGFPIDRAAAISLKAIHDFIKQSPTTTLKTISIHFLPDESKENNLEIYRKAASIQS